jgi:hypothetical protein
MNLTKEYFDKALKNLSTKDDLKKLVTKDELNDRFEHQTRLLMAYSDQQMEKLAEMSAAGFADLQARLDFSQRVKKLEDDMKKIKEALRV